MGYYLVMVKERKKVGCFGAHVVFTVENAVLIPLSPSVGATALRPLPVSASAPPQHASLQPNQSNDATTTASAAAAIATTNSPHLTKPNGSVKSSAAAQQPPPPPQPQRGWGLFGMISSSLFASDEEKATRRCLLEWSN